MPTVEKENLSSRLNFRLPSEIKERVENAALISGVTVTDFAIIALAERSEEILEKHQTRIFSNRDRDIFLKLIENPPEPNNALKNAVKAYKKRVVKK